jgi:hypothetical protein
MSAPEQPRADPQIVQAALKAHAQARQDYGSERKSEVTSLTHAPEIEESLVSMCWHEPERLSGLLRELDLSVHFVQPHCRKILEALNLCYSELGTSDWASVIQTVRELGTLGQCGGLEGLNEIFRLKENQVPGELTDSVFAHYCDMLKRYGVARASRPVEGVYRVRGGKATLYRNKVGYGNFPPDYQGEARISGQTYRVFLWVSQDGGFVNLTFAPQS